MSTEPIIQVENLSKQYRLGEVSTGTLAHDLNRWWCRVRGQPDPYIKVTQANIRHQRSEVEKRDASLPASGSRPQSSDYVWALKDISFEVQRGEVLGIIGRNGAGKSTLLKILSRITAPTSGEIRIDGRIASLLEVGTGFHPDLSGQENIYLNGAILGMTHAEIRRKLDEIVEFSGCARYLDTPVKRYSSGMKVRLGFAVAAHLEPDILIVDEVLAVGDAEFQKKCVGKMQDVASHGRTVLFVSHNMNAVMDLCPRAALLEDGLLRMSGPTPAIVDAYLAIDAQRNHLGPPVLNGGRHDTLAWLESVELTEADGRPLQGSLVTGATVAISIRYGCQPDLPSLGFGVIIKEVMTGLRVFATLSSRRGVQKSDPPVSGTARLVIDKIPLLAGRYSVSVTLNADAYEHSRQEDVCLLEVVATPSALTENGVSQQRNGVVWLSSEWQV